MKRKHRPPQWQNFDGWVVLGAGIGLGIAVAAFLLLRKFLFPADSAPGDILTATATALGGLTIGGVAIMQYRKHKWAEYQAKMDEDSRTGERLGKAIEHLGSENINIRISAVYEFVRLAEDSERDRDAIGQILLRFIHSKSKKLPREQDVETATYMLRYWARYGGLFADRMRLDDIFFSDAILVSANFAHAHLNHAFLQGAQLAAANLSKARFIEADLNNASFCGANFLYADLRGADLDGADLREVKNLETAFIDNNTRFDPGVRMKYFGVEEPEHGDD